MKKTQYILITCVDEKVIQNTCTHTWEAKKLLIIFTGSSKLFHYRNYKDDYISR